MPILLEPPLTGGGGGTWADPLREAPRFVRGPGNGRWHIPRSGVVHELGHTAYHLWCGQVMYVGGRRRAEVLGRDPWPDDGVPVCGTCAGRVVGADRAVDDLLFAPRRLDPPAVCPGSRIPGLYLEVPGNPGGTLARPTVICLACDAVTKETGGSRGYDWTPLHAAPHPPEQLVDPCPFHGWRELVPDGTGSARCRCGADPWT